MRGENKNKSEEIEGKEKQKGSARTSSGRTFATLIFEFQSTNARVETFLSRARLTKFPGKS